MPRKAALNTEPDDAANVTQTLVSAQLPERYGDTLDLLRAKLKPRPHKRQLVAEALDLLFERYGITPSAQPDSVSSAGSTLKRA